MKILAFSVVALALAGCSWLPGTGPTAKAVIDQASEGGQVRFDIIDVDDRVVDTLLKQPSVSLQSIFGQDGHPPAPKIAVGDSVVVSIWEGGADTLFGATLSIDHGAVAAGARGVTLPEQVVPPDGKITIPFAGRITVNDHTAAEAQDQIRDILIGKTMSPQVIVAVTKSTFNTVTVAGEVIKGERVPLSPSGDRILDVIAEAGGAQAPAYDVYVRLARAGNTTTIPFQDLIDTPTENIFVWPGDVLTLVRIPHSFQAIGATGKNDQINFGQEKLNVSQALAKSAGLIDDRADPNGVFLLREEPISTVRALGKLSEAEAGKPIIPIVYHFNLRDMRTYFLAQQFPVQNNDVLYVAPAQANGIQKIFSLLGTLTSPIVTGVVLNNAIP